MSTNNTTSLRDTLNAHRQALIMEQRSMQGVMLGAGWMVTDASGTPMTVDTVKEGERWTVTNVRHASLRTLSMFTEVDAKAVAANITDGHGRPGKAMHINDYLRQSLTEVDAILGIV